MNWEIEKNLKQGFEKDLKLKIKGHIR